MQTLDKQEKTFFEINAEKGLKSGLLTFSEDKTKVTYKAKREFSVSYKNPEEKVRASYFVDLVLKYQYPPNRIDFEVPTKPDKDRIDIIIYGDDQEKNVFVVVECKKDGITDTEFKNAIEQAFRYANYKKAEYALVVAGTTKAAYITKDFAGGEREENIVADIPIKYGKAPKYKFIAGTQDNDLVEVSRDDLIRALEKSHDTVWQGGKLAPTTAFDEVSKLLFCKLKDEKSTPIGKTYKFQIGTYEKPSEVFKRIDYIYQEAKKEDEEVFKEDIRLDESVVYNVVKHLQGLAINKIDLDSKGIAFEKFMQDFFKGKMGQFFTPRNVVQFAVDIMQPTNTMKVLDPACGSGGFLLNAMDKVRYYAERSFSDPIQIFSHWHNFAKEKLFGIEINDQIARVCKMNMIIHDDGHTNVISYDSLEEFENIQNINKGFKEDSFDLILTNPPFGATVKDTEKKYLKNYELGKNGTKDRKNQKTEILFIERCIQFLKPKTGKMAMVLPDGILTNSSIQYVRDLIMERCQILAIVSLPQMAFTHYGAGVKSSLLFARRLDKDEIPGNYPIFMAIADEIGYDATGRETPEKNDLPAIISSYREFEKENNLL